MTSFSPFFILEVVFAEPDEFSVLTVLYDVSEMLLRVLLESITIEKRATRLTGSIIQN